MKRPIACRIASYAPFEHLAYEHLAGLGIRHVEIPVPPPHQLDKVAAELVRFGLTASSLHAECDLRRPDVVRQVAAQLPAFKALATKLMFVSVKAEDTPFQTACQRLREAGDAVAPHGVTLALETHPDLVTNADVARRTIETVNHPHVRINYDTANVYFYNASVNAVAELRLITPWVVSVHLKDTDGGFRSWHFPALGRGVVDFPGIFAALDEARFTGPCTLEIEGLEGEQPTERLVCDRIAESVGFLRALHRL